MNLIKKLFSKKKIQFINTPGNNITQNVIIEGKRVRLVFKEANEAIEMSTNSLLEFLKERFKF